MQIMEVKEVTDHLVRSFEKLIPQLSSSNPPPTKEELIEIASSQESVLFVARDDEQDGEIVGSLTLILFRIPTGLRARIEDVVVDENSRGKGIGEALNRAALQRAAKAGSKTVELTSRPSRKAANRLYQRIGFEKRETNTYNYYIGK